MDVEEGIDVNDVGLDAAQETHEAEYRRPIRQEKFGELHGFERTSWRYELGFKDFDVVFCVGRYKRIVALEDHDGFETVAG
jgi:hypothetical protein